MIEINLVPENLRKKRRGPVVTPGPVTGLPKEALIGTAGGFVALLIVLSLILQGYITMRVFNRNALKKGVDSIAAAKTNVEKVIDEMKQIKGRVKTLEDVVGRRKISVAQKLNELSDNLPRGVWLTKVAMEGKFFIIEGSAASKAKSEINDVHALAANLKASKNFMENFKNLEVNMIKARSVEGLPIADFTIKAELAK